MRDHDHRRVHTPDVDVPFLAVIPAPVTASEHRAVEDPPGGLEVDSVLERVGPVLGLVPLERHDMVYV